MKRLVFTIATFTMLGVATVAGDQKGRGKQPHKTAVQHAAHDATHVSASVTFGSGEVRIIRDYYAPRRRALPPGLQKKVARGKPLPPGWQKKLQPFPAELERQLSPLPREYRRGVIDGHAVIFTGGTHVAIDVTAVF